MRNQEEWAPVFGWRVRDVAHLILNKPINDLPWTDDSGANLVVYPWWDELFEIIDQYEGIDIYDVPLFDDGYGGPNPSSQVGCVNAVFIGALIRLPFVANARIPLHYNSEERRYRRSKGEVLEPDLDWAKRLADDWFVIEKARIDEMNIGFDNLKKFMNDYPNFPSLIQADGNHHEYHEDIEPTWPIRFLIGNDGWNGEIVDAR
jgi:hypothetical protein